MSYSHNRSLQILETHNQVEEKKKLYLPYNILPLDPDSANQAIMRYPEVATYFIYIKLAIIVSWDANAFTRCPLSAVIIMHADPSCFPCSP